MISAAVAATLAAIGPSVPSAATSTASAIAPAARKTVHVEVADDVFRPSSVKVARGGTVVFDNLGLAHHTVTDSSGMGLYDSGSVGPDDPSTEVQFSAAGLYLYVCVFHAGMVGRVSVPVRAAPAAGSVRRVRTVRWAVSSADPGYVYDVQIKRPGKRWTAWRSGATRPSAAFTPNAVKGTYRFRARLREPGQGTTRWSAPAEIVAG